MYCEKKGSTTLLNIGGLDVAYYDICIMFCQGVHELNVLKIKQLHASLFYSFVLCLGNGMDVSKGVKCSVG